jgi:hypothetical protein
MKVQKRRMGQLLISCLLGSTALVAQQGTAPASKAPAKVAVSAPFAQQMIVKEKTMHPEIQKLGLHAVPPGQTQNVIIASNLPEKIGKVSAASDMQHVAAGVPYAEKIADEGYWDTFVPFHDHDGKVIGFLVMEVPFATAKTLEGAIKVGTLIRNEVERQVPTEAALFAPAPQK